jgi:hypothetical protein
LPAGLHQDSCGRPDPSQSKPFVHQTLAKNGNFSELDVGFEIDQRHEVVHPLFDTPAELKGQALCFALHP